MKLQNKLGAYLTVTAGAGCAASIAEAAIQVVDLSGLPTAPGASIAFPSSTGNTANDLFMPTVGNDGFLLGLGGVFYSNSQAYVDGDYVYASHGYTSASGSADFPTMAPLYEAQWNIDGVETSRFSEGVNWLPFRDNAQNFGWFSFTLVNLDTNADNANASTSAISSFGSFVYDDTSTSPANAISLETAIAAAVPEPSSLTLLALGSIGLAARRKRRETTAFN